MSLSALFSGLAVGACARCGKNCLKNTCSACASKHPTRFRTPKGIDVAALGLYEHAPGEKIRALKYEDETILAAHLGAALCPLVPQLWRHCLLLPVPLHPERLAERGFNQAALIAREIGKGAKMRIRFDLLSRVNATKAQARLAPQERAENTRNAFSFEPVQAPLKIVLVDDVVTTGNTVDSCVSAIEDGGSKVVGVLACAIAKVTERPAKKE